MRMRRIHAIQMARELQRQKNQEARRLYAEAREAKKQASIDSQAADLLRKQVCAWHTTRNAHTLSLLALWELLAPRTI